MSITSVAQAAGVSIATVSRVLNNPHLVNPGTVLKVEEAMRTLNYRVAPTGERRGRKTQSRGRLQHNTVVFLWTGGRPSSTTLTGVDMLQGASAALRRHQVNLVADYLDVEGRLPAALAGGEVDGVLLHGPEPAPEIAERLKKLPVVWLLSPGSRSWGDRVRPDHQRLGMDALNFLHAKGCENVACVTYMDHLPSFFSRRAAAFGYQAAKMGVNCTLLGQKGTEPADPASRFRIAAAVADEFAALNPRPDGLFVANELGGYLHEQFVRRGLRPMTDFLMIAGDRDFAPQHLEPEPIMVNVHGVDLGRMAVDMLLWRLENPGVASVTQLLTSTLTLPPSLA